MQCERLIHISNCEPNLSKILVICCLELPRVVPECFTKLLFSKNSSGSCYDFSRTMLESRTQAV